MAYRVYFEHGIVFCVSPEIIDLVVANDMVAAELKLIDEENGNRPTPLLVSLEGTKTMTADARKRLSQATGMDQFERIAFVGGTVFMRTVCNFLFRMSRKAGKQKFFAEKAAAVDWLNQEK